jgi:hypothetical protein
MVAKVILSECIEMYEAGQSLRTIGAAFRVSHQAIQQRLIAAGVDRRSPGWTGEGYPRPEPLDRGLMTWDEICAPGPGDWDIDQRIRVSEARNAAIIDNDCSGFPRVAMAA